MFGARQAIPSVLTSLLPLFTFLYVRRSDTGYTLTRDTWNKEYDYIIGKLCTFYKFVNLFCPLKTF